MITRTYLNLGCGHRYHPAWINMDMAASDPNVINCDLSMGIPLPENYCDVVYHAAVLEHLRIPDSVKFIKECNRVLKPGGVLRVGVPDLEMLCRLYLDRLEAASSGNHQAVHDYDWIMLEMFDQVVREQSGGKMLEWFRQQPLPNQDFVFQRVGEEARDLIRNSRLAPSKNGRRIALSLSQVTSSIFRMASKLNSLRLRTKIGELFLGKEDLNALRVGRFRMGGEVHQWMYDRFSLTRLLREAGFVKPIQMDAGKSQIPDWLDYGLDTLRDGTVIKPDLIFMEAVKPLRGSYAE